MCIFYVKSVKYSQWFGTYDADSYSIDYYTKKIERKLNESGCFNKVALTKIQLSKPPKDTIYLEFSKHIATVGFIPFFTRVLGLIFPMSYGQESTLKVTLIDNDKEQHFELSDHYKVLECFAFLILTPFLDSYESYAPKKDNDMMDAMLIKIKNEGCLRVK